MYPNSNDFFITTMRLKYVIRKSRYSKDDSGMVWVFSEYHNVIQLYSVCYLLEYIISLRFQNCPNILVVLLFYLLYSAILTNNDYYKTINAF